jgi:hypothetical protein
MDILRFHASILRIIEICLDFMRHIGKIYSADGFKSPQAGWFREGQKSPVLKSSGKREEHKPSRRRAVALLTAV